MSSVKQLHLLAAFLSETLQLPVCFRLELVPFVKIFTLRRFQSVMVWASIAEDDDPPMDVG